jgi:hypothetical protein
MVKGVVHCSHATMRMYYIGWDLFPFANPQLGATHISYTYIRMTHSGSLKHILCTCRVST